MRARHAWTFVAPDRLDSFCHSTHSLPLSLFVRTWREEAPACSEIVGAFRKAPAR